MTESMQVTHHNAVGISGGVRGFPPNWCLNIHCHSTQQGLTNIIQAKMEINISCWLG